MMKKFQLRQLSYPVDKPHSAASAATAAGAVTVSAAAPRAGAVTVSAAATVAEAVTVSAADPAAGAVAVSAAASALLLPFQKVDTRLKCSIALEFH